MSGAATSPRRRVAALLHQPWSRQRLVPEAAVALAIARGAVRRRGQFGALNRIGTRTDEGESTDDSPVGARDLGWSIAAAARTLPWNTECLTQAIAATRLLSRRGLPWRLHVGLGREDDELIAHAWVTCGRRVVVGGDEVARYARLVTYEPKPRR